MPNITQHAHLLLKHRGQGVLLMVVIVIYSNNNNNNDLYDREFRLCFQYWLGLPMVDEGVRCPICQAVADPLGDHQVGCGGNGDRIFRHDSLRDALISTAQSAALAPRKEVPSLIPGSKSRPADLYLPHWSRGRPAALDVTVISTMQALTVTGAATTQGHALSVGENRKMAAHAEACRSVGVTFVPLVVESLGGWSETAVHSIKSIDRQLGQRLWGSLLQTPLPTSSKDSLSVCGEAMPPCG